MSSQEFQGDRPFIFDEDALNDAERRAALLYAVSNPEDWMKYLTRTEHEQLQADLDEIDKRQSPYYYFTGEHPSRRDKRAEYARRGIFRAFSRRKHGCGHH